MTYHFEHSAQISMDEHVKILGDDELLDFWEESQYLDGFLQENEIHLPQTMSNCERLILQELQLRFCQREQPQRMNAAR
ncbi:hypothetical protein [Desulfonatronum parangueonense]